MGRDLIASIILHAVVLTVTIFASPLNIKKPRDYTDVVRVNIVGVQSPGPTKITPSQPIPEPPKAVKAQPKVEPIKTPDTKPASKATPIDKAKKPPEKPKAQSTTEATETGDQNKPGAPEGKVSVDAPSGSSLSGMGVDNASFNYPYWFTLAYNKLCQNFRIPIVIDGSVSCDVYFQVIKSGRVIEQKVVTSSGIPQFDEACLAAVERSAPFPPLPRDFLDEIIGIYVTFTN